MTKHELKTQINLNSIQNLDKKNDKNVLVMSDDFTLYDLDIVVNVGMKVIINNLGVTNIGENILREKMVLEVMDLIIERSDAIIYYQVISPITNERISLDRSEFTIASNDLVVKGIQYHEAV